MPGSMKESVVRRGLAGLLVQALATLLLGLALPAWAQQKQGGSVTPSAIPEGSYSQYTLQEGYSWRLIQASGYAVDDSGQYFSEPLYMIQDLNGIYNAPLPYSVMNDLANAVDADSTAFVLSQNIVNEISASEQQGYLTPALQAIAEPLDWEYEEDPYPSKQGWFGKCNDRVVNKNKSFNVATPITKDFGIGGGFSGTIQLQGNAQGTATGEIQIKLRRFKLFGVCIPYGVKFDYARAYGNVAANYGATLSGTVNYANPQPWEWPIVKPHLFDFIFFIGPIPVYVGFNLPITAGLDLKASITGSVSYNGSQTSSGYFDYVCTLDGCNGYSNFNTTNVQQPQTLTGSVSGRIQPSVYAQVAIRGYLYAEDFAYAQVGLRPYLHGDLWGFYGNNCGDADGDGYYETVDALTFDLDWQIHVTAEADSFLTKKKKWTLYDFGRRHINFWDLIGSEAIQPILAGPASVPAYTSQVYNSKMRPCWPYGDTVNYQLGWGDGGSTSFSGAPISWVPASHVWSTAGAWGLSLTALNDSHGRVFNKTTARNVTVTPGGGGGTATHYGMTWRVLGQSGAYVHVGSDSTTNPYNGDTHPSTVLPVLCLKQDGRGAPSGISFDFYNGWAAGEVRFSNPVAGSTLTSRATADAICSGAFGAGYRMGEFHDGGGGWSWWAQGVLDPNTRCWVAITDQPANPWN